MSCKLLRLIKEAWFWATRKSNLFEVKDRIVPYQTRVSAMPWYSVRYHGTVDKSYVLACEGTDGLAVMGIPLNKMYNIKVEETPA